MAQEHLCHLCLYKRGGLPAADADPDSVGVTRSSADICWPLIAAWNFTRTGRRSVFARRLTCVLFAEGGARAVTRRHTDAVHVFFYLGGCKTVSGR